MDQKKKAPGGVLGGLLPEGSDESSNLGARLERYGSARKRAREMYTHLLGDQSALGDVEKARALLADCGNFLRFHHYYTVGKVRLASMTSCKQHLLCPLCAIRRGAKALKVYLDRFEVIRAEQPHLRPYLVTFTVKNGDDLSERMEHLRGSLRTLHARRRRWLSGSKRERFTEAAKAEGAVWSYEVTNRGKGWHPHVHAIWLCRSEPKQDELRAEWEAITGDSFMVDVRPIQQDDPAEGFCEVFKYAMKFGELNLSDNVEAWRELRGKRLVGSFGAFRGVQVPDDLVDELLDELPYLELLYRYRDGVGYSLQYAQHSDEPERVQPPADLREPSRPARPAPPPPEPTAPKSRPLTATITAYGHQVTGIPYGTVLSFEEAIRLPAGDPGSPPIARWNHPGAEDQSRAKSGARRVPEPRGASLDGA